MTNSVDFYLLPHRQYSHTVAYDVQSENNGNPLVDLLFVDEDHVAIGHADGYILILAFGLYNPVKEVGLQQRQICAIQHLVSINLSICSANSHFVLNDRRLHPLMVVVSSFLLLRSASTTKSWKL